MYHSDQLTPCATVADDHAVPPDATQAEWTASVWTAEDAPHKARRPGLLARLRAWCVRMIAPAQPLASPLSSTPPSFRLQARTAPHLAALEREAVRLGALPAEEAAASKPTLAFKNAVSTLASPIGGYAGKGASASARAQAEAAFRRMTLPQHTKLH